MKTDLAVDISALLGADRVLDPPGSLPQPAERLDPSGPVRPHELELAVERLCLDSTSFRNLRERAGGDPDLIARLIVEIVEARGKLHNPDTDSGGILVGAVAAIGERFGSPPELGARIATLGSLTLTPLRLEAVTRVDPLRLAPGRRRRHRVRVRPCVLGPGPGRPAAARGARPL